MMHPDQNIEDARILARAIVNTIPEPFVVLDEQFHIVAASRSFHEIFLLDPEQTRGRLLYALGDGQWEIPALRMLLERIIPEHTAMDDFEVAHDFPGLGRRIMLLNARQVLYEDRDRATILLAFRDITARRAIEREKEELLKHTEELLHKNEILLQEMQHRVANSLQIIASILLLKARAVTSSETRLHLQDAHQRVMSVAAVQLHLHTADGVDRIEVSDYLSRLCGGLAASMVGDNQPITIKTMAHEGMIESAQAVSLGLIVTELVINAIKYAFPESRADALILVTYEIDGPDWKLIVSDNGVGKDAAGTATGEGGLGTTIVKALAKQLGARLEVANSPAGLRVCVTRATFTSRMPQAA